MSVPMAQQSRSVDQSLQLRTDTTPDHEPIKVLVPCDGSENSRVALSELSRAGLPAELEVFVAVTPVWLPSSPYEITRAVNARRLRILNSGVSSFIPALRDREEQQVLSREAERLIHSDLAPATVRTEVLDNEGTITSEVIRTAKQWGAELIVVGAKTSPSPEINDYAGPGLKIARQAACSVRVARASANGKQSKLRLIVALERPESSAELVAHLAGRVWPIGTEAQLVLMRRTAPSKPGHEVSRNLMLEQLAEQLRSTNLSVSTNTADRPEDILRTARELGADCIFINATESEQGGLSAFAQTLVLGAACSVEVVRRKGSQEFKRAA